MYKKNRQLSRVVPTSSEPRKTGTKGPGNPGIFDCYGVLKSSAFVWRVMGIFPLTIEGLTGRKKYRINKYYVAHSCLIFLVCNMNIVNMLSDWRTEEINMAVSILLVRSISSVLSMLIVIIWRIFRHNELSKLIATLAAQEFMLRKMNCRMNRESNEKTIRACVWTTTIIATFLVAYNHFTAGEMLTSQGMKWVLWCMPVVIQVVDLTIFASLVGLIGLQFRALNERIKTVALRTKASSPKVIVTSDECAENVLFIARTHYNICALGKRINHFFDWIVIIDVITAFIILSTTLYKIFVEIQREHDTDYFRVGMHVQWEFIHSAPIIGLVFICNWTTHEGIHAGKLIHEIRIIEKDSRLHEAVKSFSLQLHHQKLQFNAHGFFPLDSTLLQTIVGNITTNLVLLIQFQPKIN